VFGCNLLQVVWSVDKFRDFTLAKRDLFQMFSCNLQHIV